MYGHVNNANYLNYLEYARYEYLRSIGFDFPALAGLGFGVYIARIEIDYRAPARMDETLAIRTRPVKKGAASGTLRQQIWREDRLLIEALVTWAFVDTKTGAPTKIPPAWDLPGLYPET